MTVSSWLPLIILQVVTVSTISLVDSDSDEHTTAFDAKTPTCLAATPDMWAWSMKRRDLVDQSLVTGRSRLPEPTTRKGDFNERCTFVDSDFLAAYCR